MRSLAPLESEMVPPPDHDPDRPANGPAPWAWACAVNSKASANAAPHELRVQDDIDGDGIKLPPVGRTASAANASIRRPAVASIGEEPRFVKGAAARRG